MTRRMTDAEIALHENALGPDVEFMSPATLASTGLLLVEELRATREELAKVRAKSEERRRLLEEGQLHPDAFTRARCFGCGRRPCAEGCEVAAALKEEA